MEAFSIFSISFLKVNVKHISFEQKRVAQELVGVGSTLPNDF